MHPELNGVRVFESADSLTIRKYNHSELQTYLYPDYRERVKSLFVERGRIEYDKILNWREPSHPEYTHKGSMANYILWEKIGNDILVASVIPKFSQTGPEHSHPEDVLEIYECLFGSYDLIINGSPVRIRQGESRVVKPGEKHMVKTGNSFALLPIVIENGALHDPSELHIR